MNAAGLLLGAAARGRGGGEDQKPKELVGCFTGQARWHSEGECFTPTQVHINIAVGSILLNIVLVLVVIVLWRRKK